MCEHEGKDHCCCHGEGHGASHDKIKEHMEQKKKIHQDIVEKIDRINEKLDKILEKLDSK